MKPIFIIKLPEISRYYYEGIKKELIRFREDLEKDYHVLIFSCGEEYDFKMFSDKEIDPIKLEELKELCLKNLNQ